MHRRRRIRSSDIPRLLVTGAVHFAGLFGGKYRRSEGAHVFAVDDKDRVLVVRTTYLGPGWTLPGGRVERGETPHDAAVRETREETGLDVELERLLLIDARQGRDVSLVFGARVVRGEMEPQLGEIAEVAWLSRIAIAESSPELQELLEVLEGAADGIVYRGLGDGG